MRQLLTAGLDLLFPPSPEELRVRAADSTAVLTHYAPNHFQHIQYLSYYSTPLMQALITQNKFHHSRLAAQHLGTLLNAWHSTQSPNTIYLPIPLSRHRARSRGHNQVLSILAAAKLLPHTHHTVLQRTRNTVAQSSLDRHTRLTNMKDAFTASPPALAELADKNVIIIDDVVTTGATLLAAKQAITPHLPSGSTLTLLAIAH